MHFVLADGISGQRSWPTLQMSEKLVGASVDVQRQALEIRTLKAIDRVGSKSATLDNRQWVSDIPFLNGLLHLVDEGLRHYQWPAHGP